MAEVAFLHYRPGKGALHRLPGVVKLLCLICLSLLISQLGWKGLMVTAFLLAAGGISARPALSRMTGALFFALVMGGLLGFSRFRETGVLLESLWATVRFLQVYFLGIVMTTVTDPDELGQAFYLLTGWIPFFPARRLKTLITLTLLFLPLIMDESLTLERAAKCRCFHRRRNPFIRLRYRVEPLIEGVFRKSDDISRAMAARCYGEEA